jgi:hypothetical protein
LFPKRHAGDQNGTSLRPAALFGTVDSAGALWFAMSDIGLLQFEVIRTIAASLISVAIVLLWLVVISRQ